MLMQSFTISWRLRADIHVRTLIFSVHRTTCLHRAMAGIWRDLWMICRPLCSPV